MGIAAMSIEAGPGIAGARLVDLSPHGDERGMFVETFRREWFSGVPDMVQTNVSTKQAGAVVGLHYHLRQADYWYVIAGTARVGLYDLRVGSPSEGTSWSSDFDDRSQRGLYIPPGVGHGFAAITDVTLLYQVDGYYDPADELGVAWDDPQLDIEWGVCDPVVSERDRSCPRLASIPASIRPAFRG